MFRKDKVLKVSMCSVHFQFFLFLVFLTYAWLTPKKKKLHPQKADPTQFLKES